MQINGCLSVHTSCWSVHTRDLVQAQLEVETIKLDYFFSSVCVTADIFVTVDIPQNQGSKIVVLVPTTVRNAVGVEVEWIKKECLDLIIAGRGGESQHSMRGMQPIYSGRGVEGSGQRDSSQKSNYSPVALLQPHAHIFTCLLLFMWCAKQLSLTISSFEARAIMEVFGRYFNLAIF